MEIPSRRNNLRRRIDPFDDLLAFVDDFDTRNRCVVHDGFKGNVELALCGGLKVVEGLDQGMKAARFLVNIEVIEQRVAVA